MGCTIGYLAVFVQVFVKLLDGKTTTIDIMSDARMKVFKSAVQGKSGIPAHAQRLIYAGHQLENKWTLDDYGIWKESTVHLVLKLCGD